VALWFACTVRKIWNTVLPPRHFLTTYLPTMLDTEGTACGTAFVGIFSDLLSLGWPLALGFFLSSFGALFTSMALRTAIHSREKRDNNATLQGE
jgi:membrane protein implicated in regulation of membrane protease activity